MQEGTRNRITSSDLRKRWLIETWTARIKREIERSLSSYSVIGCFTMHSFVEKQSYIANVLG